MYGTVQKSNRERGTELSECHERQANRKLNVFCSRQIILQMMNRNFVFLGTFLSQGTSKINSFFYLVIFISLKTVQNEEQLSRTGTILNEKEKKYQYPIFRLFR